MSVLRGWRTGHVVAPESLRRFPERRLGGNRRMRPKTNRPRDGWVLATEPAGQAGAAPRGSGCGASPRAAPAAAAAPGHAVPERGSPRTEHPPKRSIPRNGAPSLSQSEPPGVSHLPAHLSPALEAACHAPCQASGILPAPGVVLLWQSAALIINLCRKQIQKPLLSFTAWNSALPTVPS